MTYRTLNKGIHGITIIVDAKRDVVWVAASVGGTVRSALGLRFGHFFDPLANEELAHTARMWRPAFWHPRARGCWPGDYGEFIHTWWDWLGYIVNEVTQGHIRSGSSVRYSNHQKHTAAFKARLLAEKLEDYLEATYRNG